VSNALASQLIPWIPPRAERSLTSSAETVFDQAQATVCVWLTTTSGEDLQAIREAAAANLRVVVFPKIRFQELGNQAGPMKSTVHWF
jgi:hypothetical protein